MVPFPKTREQSNSQPTCDCFIFLGPSGPDEQSDEKKDSEDDVQASFAKVDSQTKWMSVNTHEPK